MRISTKRLASMSAHRPAHSAPAVEGIRRAVAVLVVCCLLVQAFGCTSTRSVPVDQRLAAVQPKVTAEPGARIHGYVTSDGVSHKFNGWVRLDGEEFVFQPVRKAHRGELIGDQEPSFRLPRLEVVSFAEQKIHIGKTVLLAIGITIGFYALVIGIAVAMGEDIGP